MSTWVFALQDISEEVELARLDSPDRDKDSQDRDLPEMD
jgi:hypothetical protein